MGTTAAFFGQVLINTLNSTITVDSTDGNLTSGTYYGWTPDAYGDGYNSAVDELANTISSLASSAVVTASISADGYLTLTGTASFDIENFDAYDLFGFSSDSMTGETSYTATSRVQASWIPGRDPSSMFGSLSSQGRVVPIVSQAQGADGTTYTSLIGTIVKQKLALSYLSGEATWGGDSARNSGEEWYETCCDGRKILFIPNFTGSGSYTTYWEYVLNLMDMKDWAPKRHGPSDTLWKVEISLLGV